MARPRLTIDLGAIARNWQALDAKSAAQVETGAVLKADAYGLGAEQVAPVLARAGVRSYFVALAEEGIALRKALGAGPKIYVFSGLMPGDLPLVRDHGLIPLLNSPEQVRDFAAGAQGLPCGLQLDSGMNRLGLEAADLTLCGLTLAGLGPELVISHLACADSPGHLMNTAQAATFAAMSALFPTARKSLSATGGILLGPAWHLDMTRPGVGLFGGLPFAQAEPVVQISLPVIQTRDVLPGESVGYGNAWRATGLTRIATVAAGYADGIRRSAAAGLRLFAGDTPCPVVGRISMDLIGVNVSALPRVPDALELFGPGQGLDDVAAAAGTIGYEILTGLGQRFDRRYTGAAD